MTDLLPAAGLFAAMALVVFWLASDNADLRTWGTQWRHDALEIRAQRDTARRERDRLHRRLHPAGIVPAHRPWPRPITPVGPVVYGPPERIVEPDIARLACPVFDPPREDRYLVRRRIREVAA